MTAFRPFEPINHLQARNLPTGCVEGQSNGLLTPDFESRNSGESGICRRRFFRLAHWLSFSVLTEGVFCDGFQKNETRSDKKREVGLALLVALDFLDEVRCAGEIND